MASNKKNQGSNTRVSRMFEFSNDNNVQMIVVSEIKEKKSGNYRRNRAARHGAMQPKQTIKSRVLMEIRTHGACTITNMYDDSINVTFTPGNGVRIGTPGKVGHLDGRKMRPIKRKEKEIIENKNK